MSVPKWILLAFFFTCAGFNAYLVDKGQLKPRRFLAAFGFTVLLSWLVVIA